MAISLVQTKGGSSGAYTNSFTFSPTSSLTSGNYYFVAITAGTADVQPSVSDGTNGSYTMDLNTANPTSGERQTWLFRVKVSSSGTPTVTVSYSSGFPDSSYIAREYSGLASSSVLDKTSTNNDGTSFNTTHDAGTTATTTQSNELVILFGGSSAGSDPSMAAGTGYGNGLEQKGFDLYTYTFMSDKIISSTGTQSGNFTSTGSVRGQAGIATYKGIALTTSTNNFFF